MRDRPRKPRGKKPKTTIESVSVDVGKALRNRGHLLTLGMPVTQPGGRATVREGMCLQCGAAVHIEVIEREGSLVVTGPALTGTCQGHREAHKETIHE